MIAPNIPSGRAPIAPGIVAQTIAASTFDSAPFVFPLPNVVTLALANMTPRFLLMTLTPEGALTSLSYPLAPFGTFQIRTPFTLSTLTLQYLALTGIGNQVLAGNQLACRPAVAYPYIRQAVTGNAGGQVYIVGSSMPIDIESLWPQAINQRTLVQSQTCIGTAQNVVLKASDAVSVNYADVYAAGYFTSVAVMNASVNALTLTYLPPGASTGKSVQVPRFTTFQEDLVATELSIYLNGNTQMIAASQDVVCVGGGTVY